MIAIRESDKRGNTETGWLSSRHTFSFDQYYDPKNMSFRSLRVMNEDWIAGGGGFPTHPHRDMEILTYVLEGALEHRDSLGNGSVIRPGELQRMSAGTGISHSEYNSSKTDAVRLLQIWIMPERRGLKPGYEQHPFDKEKARGRFHLIASRDGRDDSVTVHQDMELYTTILSEGDRVVYDLAPGRYAWVQAASGEIILNGIRLKAGDGAAVGEKETLEIKAESESEILLFDLA